MNFASDKVRFCKIQTRYKLNREYYIVARKFEIYFECSTGYITSERRERVGYPAQHEK